MLIWITTLLLVSATLFGLLRIRLRQIILGKKNATIYFIPTDLRHSEVVFALLWLFAKVIISPIRSKKGSISESSENSTVTLDGPFKIAAKDIARYREAVACKNDQITTISELHLPFFLSATTEPAMLLLLLSPHCPVSPLGAVNVRNRFEFLRPDLCAVLSASSTAAKFNASFEVNHARKVKRGTEYDLQVAITMPDKDREGAERVVVFRQIFTMLEFGTSKAIETNSSKMPVGGETTSNTLGGVHFSFDSDAPWQWANLCKDYNVIHLSGGAAKLFGLPGKLAHGNHVAARALESLAAAGLAGESHYKGPSWVEVQFKKPVVVPCGLSIQCSRSGYCICKNGREYVCVDNGPL